MVQSSPSYRLMKSRSESDLSQPESDEEGYTLVETHSLSLLYTQTHLSVSLNHEMTSCRDSKASSDFVLPFRAEGETLTWTWPSLTKREVKTVCRKL